MPEQKKTEEQPTEPKPKRKRKLLRMFGCAFLVGAFLLIAAVVAINFYLTDQRIRKILIEAADTHLQKGALKLDKLNFRFASGLTIDGIAIENQKADADGQVLQIEKVVVKYDLTSLAKGTLLVDEVIVRNPVLVLSQKNGRWNFQELIPEGPAVPPQPETESAPIGAIWLPLDLDAQKLSIENLQVRLRAEPGIEIDITGANVNAKVITEGFGEKATVAENLSIESVKIRMASIGGVEFSVQHQFDLESNLVQGDLDKFESTLKLPGLAEQKLRLTGKGFGKKLKLEEFVLETNLADLRKKLGPIFSKFIEPLVTELRVDGIVKVKAGGEGGLADQLDESTIHLHGSIETRSDISSASPAFGVTDLETMTKYALNLPLFNPVPSDIEVSGTVKWQKLTGLGMATVDAGTVSWHVAADNPTTELKAKIDSEISSVEGNHGQDNAIIEDIKFNYEAHLTNLRSGNLVTSAKNSFKKIILKQEGQAGIATVQLNDVKVNLDAKTNIEEVAPTSEISVATGRLVATQKTPAGEAINASAEAIETLIKVEMTALQKGEQEINISSSIDRLNANMENTSGETTTAKVDSASTELNLKTEDLGQGKVEIRIQNACKTISCEAPVATVEPLDTDISLHASADSLTHFQSGVLDISKLQISVKELLQTNLVAAIDLKEGHLKLDQFVDEINLSGVRKVKLKALPLHQHGLESGGKISGEIHLEGRLPTDEQIKSSQLPLNLTIDLKATDLLLGMNGIKTKIGKGSLKFSHSPDQRFELSTDNRETEISITSLKSLGDLIDRELPEVQINAKPDLMLQVHCSAPTSKQISDLSFDLKLATELKTSLEASLGSGKYRTEFMSKEIGLITNLTLEEAGNAEVLLKLETQPNEIGFQLTDKPGRLAIPEFSLNVPLRVNLKRKTVETYEGGISYRIGDWARGQIEIQGGLEDGVVFSQERELNFRPILKALGPTIQKVIGITPAITGSLKEKSHVKYKAGADLKGSEFDASLRLDLDFESLQLDEGKLLNVPSSWHNGFDISVSHAANSPLVKLKYVQTMPETKFAVNASPLSVDVNVDGVKNEFGVDFDLDRQLVQMSGKSRKALSDLRMAMDDISIGGKSLIFDLKLDGSLDLKKEVATFEAELVNAEKGLDVNAGIKVQIPEIDETYHVRVVHDLNSSKLPVVEFDLNHTSKLKVPGLYSGEISRLKIDVKNTAEATSIFTASVDSKVSHSEVTVADSEMQLGDIEARVKVERLDLETGDAQVTSAVSSTSFGDEFKIDVMAALKKWAEVFSMDLKLQGLDIGKVNEDMLRPMVAAMKLPVLVGELGGLVDSEISFSGRLGVADSGDGSAQGPAVSGNAKLTISELIVEAGIPGIPSKASLLGDSEGEQTEDAILGVEDGTLELNLQLPEGGDSATAGLALRSTFFMDTSSAAIAEPTEIKSEITIGGFDDPLIRIREFTAAVGEILQARLKGKVVPSDLSRTFLTLSLDFTPEELLPNLEEDLVTGLFGTEPLLEGKVGVSLEARGNPQTKALEITNFIKVNFPEIVFGTLAAIQEFETDLAVKTSLSLGTFEPGKTEVNGSISAGESAFLDGSIALVGIEESEFRTSGSSLSELVSSFEIVIYELGYEDPYISLPFYDLELSAVAALNAVDTNVQLDEFTLSILEPPEEEGGDPYEWFTLGPLKGQVKEGGKEISMSSEGAILDLSIVAEILAGIVPEIFTDVGVKGDGLRWNVAMKARQPSDGDKGSNQYRLLKALMGAMPPQLVEKLSAGASLPRHEIEMDLWGVELAADGDFKFELAKDDLKMDGVLRLSEISGLEDLKVQPKASVKIDFASLSDLRFETGLSAASGIGANINGRVSGIEFLYGTGSLDTSLANMIEQLGGNVGLELSVSLDDPMEVAPDISVSGGITVRGDVKAKRSETLLLDGYAELSALAVKLVDDMELVGLEGRVPFRKLFRTLSSRQTAQSETSGLSTELNVEGQKVRQGKQRWRFQKQFRSYRSDVRPLQFEKLAYKGKTIVTDFVMPLSVIDGELRIDSFKMKLLNGDVSASVSVAAVNGTPRLSVNGEFVGVAGGDVSSSKGKDVGGVRGDFNLLLEIDETGQSGGISELKGAFHITEIGKKELLRMIDALDPQRAQPDLNTIRTALGIGRPDRVEFKIRHGSLSGKVTLSLPIGKSEIPIGETPLTQVIRSKSIQKTLDKSLEAAANLIFMLSAETLIIGEGDQIRFE